MTMNLSIHAKNFIYIESFWLCLYLYILNKKLLVISGLKFIFHEGFSYHIFVIRATFVLFGF